MIIVSRAISADTKTKLENAGHIVIDADPNQVLIAPSDTGPYTPPKQEPYPA